MPQDSLSGFLLIDKPAGISSFDIIRQLRKQTNTRTFGHAGTLDPFATGLIIIAVNRYTRLLSLLDYADKEYIANLVLGKATTTGDPEGEIVSTSETQISPDKLSTLMQDILQIEKLKPPIYSAIKIDGKRAYTRARADEDFELPERESYVHCFEILEYVYPNLVYQCRVSKGTYIRSLSQWIAEYLGTVGYTAELKRTAIGSVSLQKAVQLDEVNAETLPGQLVSVLDIIPAIDSISLDEVEFRSIRNGNCITNEGIDCESILIFDDTKQCRGIGYRKDNTLYPRVNI